MNARSFASPVHVADGPGIVREIGSVADALDFLDEWPEMERDLKFDTVLQACRRAHGGHAPLFVARDAFMRWAREVNILEDVPMVAPWMIAKLAGSGGVPG